MNRLDIVSQARKWMHTPFVPQGRVLGVGVDCAGLIEMVPKALGFYTDAQIEPYSMQPDVKRMRQQLEKHLDIIGFHSLNVGDVVWFRVEREPQHLAIISEIDPLMMIHASSRPRVMKVYEEELSPYWRARVQGCYRYRGIED